ncbi:shootin-1-like [Contarinia nasturtii]|uniref:shootin-1-like n=1 Tax=Contarinia nasturtii TaxID=265458 RepID=UPI0012D4850F|nr:shootin-1-like [Contarinia nasturtii]
MEEDILKKFNIRGCKVILEQKNFDEYRQKPNQRRSKRKRSIHTASLPEQKKVCHQSITSRQSKQLIACLGCGEHQVTSSKADFSKHNCPGRIDTGKIKQCIEVLQKSMDGCIEPAELSQMITAPPPPPPPPPKLLLAPPLLKLVKSKSQPVQKRKIVHSKRHLDLCAELHERFKKVSQPKNKLSSTSPFEPNSCKSNSIQPKINDLSSTNNTALKLQTLTNKEENQSELLNILRKRIPYVQDTDEEGDDDEWNKEEN